MRIIFIVIVLECSCFAELFSQNVVGNIKDINKTNERLSQENILLIKIKADSLREFNSTAKLIQNYSFHNLEQDIIPFNLRYLSITTADSLKHDNRIIIQQNITSFLETKFKEIPDLSLGIIGEYLKTAKKITAIILAVLSL